LRRWVRSRGIARRLAFIETFAGGGRHVGLLSRRLHALQLAQRALHLSHHDRELGAAAHGGRDIVGEL
jgi:hypothetical protein